MKKGSLVIISALLLIVYVFIKEESQQKNIEIGTEFYVGTYTKNSSEGIYKYSLRTDGTIDSLGLVAKTENPSFLVKSIDKKYLLSVNENEEGTVESFEIENDSLKFINRSSTGGAHPCFITINNKGNVLVANYTGGNVGLLQLAGDGKISHLLDVQQHYGNGSSLDNQKSPHAHSVWFNEADNKIISVDLGTNELIMSSIDYNENRFIDSSQYKIKMAHGAGPRHLTFHPKNNWIYVVNEINSTVSLLIKEEGNYVVKSSYSTLPENFEGENNCADIHVSDDGKFLYASNRGHNSIVIFSINTNGALTQLGLQSTKGNAPRNFSLSPDNKFILVANQLTENIVSFKRNAKTGLLTYVMEVKAPTPVCILF